MAICSMVCEKGVMKRNEHRVSVLAQHLKIKSFGDLPILSPKDGTS